MTDGKDSSVYDVLGLESADDASRRQREDARRQQEADRQAGRPGDTGAIDPDRARRVLWAANFLVFASSTCVMTLELVAARLVAQNLGASLYTWTSVIGVILAGISIGNWVGGNLADRYRPRRVLPLLFLAASVTSFSVLWLNAGAERIYRPEALAWPLWVLLNVTVIFIVPAAILGTISPVAAKWALDQRHRTGATVGKLYAWAAVGSIFGTFLTGFVLIDAMGTRAIVASVAGGLALLGIGVGIGQRKAGTEFLASWLAVLSLMGLLAFGPWPWAQEWGIFFLLRMDDRHLDYYDESNYFAIQVYEAGDIDNARVLALDNLVHSYVPTDDITRLIYDYETVYAAVTHRAAEPGEPVNALFIGGGGFVFPRYLEEVYPAQVIDVAEIDPAVTEAARQALDLPPDDETVINVHSMDARNFVDDRLRTNAGAERPLLYDYAYGDAFNDLSVPWHLTTREFTAKVHDLLTPDGVYLVNIIDVYDQGMGRFLGAFVATVAESFPNVYVFSSDPEGPTEFRDTFVVACSRQPLDLDELGSRPDDPPYEGTLFAWLENGEPGGEMETVLERARGLVLTDDYAPVENLLAPLYGRD